MKKKSAYTKAQVLHICVMQNGAVVAEDQFRLSRNHRIVVRSKGGRGLNLPHYPLPDGSIEIGRIRKGQVEIHPPPSWSGYLTSKGVVADIHANQPVAQGFQLRQGDYGVLAKSDLQILLRIGGARQHVGPDRHVTPAAGRGTLNRLIFRDPQSVPFFGLAVLVCLCIFGSAGAGLMQNKTTLPESLADLPNNYMMPFVHPDHFELGPEYLQKNLDRAYWERSVLSYQKSFAALILGRRHYNASFHAPTTITTYEEGFRKVAENLQKHETKQAAVDDRALASDDDGLLVIPAIKGETAAGSALRLLDKLEIHSETLRISLGAKRNIKEELAAVEPYDYENYNRRKNYSDRLSQATKQINTFGGATDEDAMYTEGRKKAEQARAIRQKIKEAQSETELSFTSHQPIGMTIGSELASFRREFDLGMLDGRLDDIPATVYGTKPKAVKRREPLTGHINRDLVEDFIRRNRFQLQLCYELALRRDERARGRMEWKWRINSRGQISEIDLVSSTIDDRRMVGCVRRKIAAWRFPRPTAGLSVEIRYPFDFQPARG